MASSGGGSLNTSSVGSHPSFSLSSQFMTSSFSDLLSQPSNEYFGSNWGFETPKPKSFQNLSLPFSPPPVSPSSYLGFLDSPIQVSTSNVSFINYNSSYFFPFFQDIIFFELLL